MAETKKFEIVHQSGGGGKKRERKFKFVCEAIDCTTLVRTEGDLCSSCEEKDEKMKREYAIW